MGLNEKMIELADAIRELTGVTDLLSLDEMIQHLQAASGSAVVNTVEGATIIISDCLSRKLHGLNLYGKTTQAGTPTPAAPVELESVGIGSVSVYVDDQTLTISMPNGLPGIPVSSGGNYTDANGQRWICDEIDFARGKYIKRIKTKNLAADELCQAPHGE